MKIALIQLNPVVGDIAGNARKIIRYIGEAKKEGANLAIFPEMALLGYPPRDLLELPSMTAHCAKAMAEVAVACQGITALVGTIEPNPASVGKPLFNAAAWCEEGVVKKTFRKSLLPAYDVFDESRHFEPSAKREVVNFCGHPLGITICEDIWNDPSLWKKVPYPVNPVTELVKLGTQILINISSSPFAIGKIDQRLEMVTRLSSRHGICVVYVNQVGGNDELIFDGGSMAVNREGKLVAMAPFFREGMTLVNLFSDPAISPQIPEELFLLEEALVCGIRDYMKKCGFKKATLGLSGGVDSALVAYLASKALGPKNVLGLIMPSRYSSRGSRTDALLLAKKLGMTTKEIPIDSIHKAYEKAFLKLFGKKKGDTTEENIQARIRGNLLMAVSNKLGHLVLSTGNKSELGVGYCTLYGDMSGGLAVISDLPKTEVYRLACHINLRRKIIPESILTKPPSAELKPNQTDQDTLPPYAELDAIIKAHVEDLKSEYEIVQMGFGSGKVKKVLSMISHNEYKRRQAAPGLRVTSKAFGMGRRFPIACKV